MNEHEITLRGYRAGNKNGCDILRLGTNGSYGIERLHLVPDGDWEGLTITAVFHAPDGTAIQVLADGGTVDVPPEATASAGRGKVIFIGSAQGQQRISCDLAYNVLGHAPAEGTDPAGPAPSWYEQATAHFLPDGGKAGQVLAKASDADLDVEWADGGNGSGTADHAKLSNRDAADQHPISAITGLEAALDGKQPTGDYLTADSLQAATDAALAQAKASGEFDGADGKSAYQYAVDGGYTGTEAEFAAKLAEEKFANPNALTFTGAVTGSYDGSAPVSVEIPSVGGSGSAENWRLVNTVTTAEDVSDIRITQDSDGNPLSLKKVKIFVKLRGNSASLSHWCRITVNNLTNNFYSDIQNTFAATGGQDYYNYARADFAIYAGRLMLDLLLRSLNNAASKNTLFYMANTGCNENYPDFVDAITSIRMWSASAGIGAGTELMIYGVDA